MLLPSLRMTDELCRHQTDGMIRVSGVSNVAKPGVRQLVSALQAEVAHAVPAPTGPPRTQPQESKEPNRQRDRESVKKLETELIDNIYNRILEVIEMARKEGPPYEDFDAMDESYYLQVRCPHSIKHLIRILVHRTNIRLNDHGGWESTGVRCAIMACEYLRRSRQFILEGFLQSFFFTAFMLAFKNNDDETLPLTFFSEIGEFESRDVRLMELSMCSMMEWRLAMSNTQYQYTRELVLPKSVREKTGNGSGLK